MLTVTAARGRAQKKYEQNFARWAVGSRTDPVFELPLHPPTQTGALASQEATIAWVRSWRDAGLSATVWVERQWASLGTQSLPERLRFTDPAAIAEFVRQRKHWASVSTRAEQLMVRWGDGPEVTNAVRRNARIIAELDTPNFERLLAVLEWLVANPDSGMYIRQLPIPGVDTKWVGAHRKIVTDLVLAATGQTSLGLINPPDLIRMRFLDPQLAPGGVTDLAAPLPELADLVIRPEVVLVFENLESVVAMPPIPGAVVVHGSGYAIDRIADIPWALAAPIVYWGDLDSHGLAILNRLRSYTDKVCTVLMDLPTLEEYEDLWATEPSPNTGALNNLTDQEQATLARLRELGHVRLEQERLPWPMCISVLEEVAHSIRSSANPTL